MLYFEIENFDFHILISLRTRKPIHILPAVRHKLRRNIKQNSKTVKI